MDVKRISYRIIVIVEGVILNVISVYAPQAGCDDSVKDKFWEDFDSVVCEKILYMGGDFNGHVDEVKEEYERVHGGWDTEIVTIMIKHCYRLPPHLTMLIQIRGSKTEMNTLLPIQVASTQRRLITFFIRRISLTALNTAKCCQMRD